jgi:probable HAF family extracellular repeat protein
MRLRTLSIIATIVLFSGFANAMQGAVHSMKMLTPQVGWAASQNRLFWTVDGGGNWTDITPTADSNKTIASVFFLDAWTGWVLFADDGEEPQPVFELTSTSSAGQSWSPLGRLRIPALGPNSAALSGKATIDFADTRHGWLNLGIVSSSNFELAVLLSTSDGGLNWDLALDSPGTQGTIRSANSRLVFLAGGPGDEQLFVTRDGSANWEQLSLQPPASVGKQLRPLYEAPTFRDSKDGLLPVTYFGPGMIKPALVLFATDDGGRKWTVKRVFSDLDTRYSSVAAPTTVVDSTLLMASEAPNGLLTLTAAGSTGTTVRSAPSPLGAHAQIDEMSFSTRDEGWILAHGKLIATIDGGTAWFEVTPSALKGETTSQYENRAAEILSSKGESFRNRHQPSTGEFTSADLGFDICDATTTGNMQTWWDDSPFFDAGIYIGGISRTCSNTQLSSSWVSSVESQGWGLIPLWVGPQAPCACKKTKKGCIPFKHRFTDKNAAQQGKSEADTAVAEAKTLGLGTIIYYDMEQYTQGGSCGKAVENFVGSWDEELLVNGFSGGVYGAPADAQTDWSQSYPLPDAVMISKTPKSGPPNVSIWGLSPLCDPFAKKCGQSFWLYDQRIHQYLIDQTNVSYGGVQVAKTVDFDSVDAPVATGGGKLAPVNSFQSSCTKDCTFDYTSIDYPNAKLTNALGINDVGDIVGYYYYSPTARHGFLYSNGQYTSIEYPNAAQTEAWAINDTGQIVGYYIDSNSNFFGFLYSNGQYSQISLGNNTFTVALGINDDGQIVGYYQDSAGYHGFLDNTNTGTITNIDNGTGTIVRNLNGDSIIVGLVQGGSSFLYDAVTGNFVNIDPTIYGINSSLEMVGGNTLYDYENGSQVAINYPGSTGTAAFSVNDYTEIVGNWYDTNGGQHGFLATPHQ